MMQFSLLMVSAIVASLQTFEGASPRPSIAAERSSADASAAYHRFGSWLVFDRSNEEDRHCTIVDDVFRFRMRARNLYDFGGYIEPEEHGTPPIKITGVPYALSIRRIIGKRDIIQVKTVSLPANPNSDNGSSQEIHSDDPRLSIEVRYESHGGWQNASSLLPFLQSEEKVAVIYMQNGEPKTHEIALDGMSEAISYCKQVLGS